jgi:hypothetical protein
VIEMQIEETTPDDVLRERAIRHLKKRRDFAGNLLVYVLVNTFIVLIWFMTARTDSSGRCSRSWDGGSAS